MTSPAINLPLDSDDLLEALGVEIPWPEPKRPRARGEAPKRHTDWNNATSFKFGGYLASVVQTTCEHCGSMRETFEGVFSEEVKVATGARRLQALDRAQWPAGGGHRCEVKQAFTKWCPDCIRGLGFDREVEAPGGQRELWVR